MDAVGGSHADLRRGLHQNVEALLRQHPSGRSDACWRSRPRLSVRAGLPGVCAASSRSCGPRGGPAGPGCFNLLANGGASQAVGAAARLTGRSSPRPPQGVKRTKWSLFISCWLQTDPADPDILIQPFSEQCSSANMELWLTAVFGYKGPLLVGHVRAAWACSSTSQPSQAEPGAASGGLCGCFSFRVWDATWPGASGLSADQQRAVNGSHSPCSL